MVPQRVAAAQEDGERDEVAHQQQSHRVIQRGTHHQVRNIGTGPDYIYFKKIDVIQHCSTEAQLPAMCESIGI